MKSGLDGFAVLLQRPATIQFAPGCPTEVARLMLTNTLTKRVTKNGSVDAFLFDLVVGLSIALILVQMLFADLSKRLYGIRTSLIPARYCRISGECKGALTDLERYRRSGSLSTVLP